MGQRSGDKHKPSRGTGERSPRPAPIDRPECTMQDHKPSEHAPPAAPLTTPPQVDSPQPLSHAARAQTGATDRLARILSAPPGAHISSPAPVHPSVRPRELVSPAQPPAQGDGGLQHAPVLRESTMALSESAGALTAWRPGPTC